MVIEFDWDADGLKKYVGEVVTISKVNKETTDKSSEALYSAYIRFEPDEQVRLGMSVMVRVVDEEDLPEDETATELSETDKGGID